ncbi:MAG: VOC family protein [Pseudomonadota bacterium]
MSTVELEHANITVTDAKATAEELCRIFDWTIRWEGAAKDNGYSVHVGSKNSYLAVYTPGEPARPGTSRYTQLGHLNHVGVVVGDLDATEERVKSAGYVPNNHGDYEPGRRFYFDNADGIEIEVMSYD